MILKISFNTQIQTTPFVLMFYLYTYKEPQSINKLTLTQLQHIVAGYKVQVLKRNIAPQQQKNKSNIQHPSQKKSETKYNLQQRKSKIQYDRFGTYDYQQKGPVACIQAQRIIKQQNLLITVPQMETKQIEGYIFGIGARTQYYYHVQSNLIKGTVKRLSEDFDWLNDTLLRLFPYILMPQLDPVRKDIKNPYLVRQKQIQQYLQHLAQKKVLINSYIFTDFLTISSQKMQKFKKSYDSMGFIQGVSLLKMPQGFVQIELSNKTRQFYANSKQFTKKTAALHESLTLALTKMIQSYKVTVTDTYAVVDIFAELYDVFNPVNMKNPSLKITQYSDTLVNLNNLFLGIGDNVKNVADTLQKYTADYFRFYKNLDINMAKLQKHIKDSQAQYLQFKSNLQRKKQRVISDPSKWDLDNREIDTKSLSKQQLMKLILPKQVLVESELKAWYGYNLKSYQNQFNCYLEFLTRRYQNVFKLLAVQLLSNDKHYLEIITNFISQDRKLKNQSNIQKQSPV